MISQLIKSLFDDLSFEFLVNNGTSPSAGLHHQFTQRNAYLTDFGIFLISQRKRLKFSCWWKLTYKWNCLVLECTTRLLKLDYLVTDLVLYIIIICLI